MKLLDNVEIESEMSVLGTIKTVKRNLTLIEHEPHSRQIILDCFLPDGIRDKLVARLVTINLPYVQMTAVSSKNITRYDIAMSRSSVKTIKNTSELCYLPLPNIVNSDICMGDGWSLKRNKNKTIENAWDWFWTSRFNLDLTTNLSHYKLNDNMVHIAVREGNCYSVPNPEPFDLCVQSIIKCFDDFKNNKIEGVPVKWPHGPGIIAALQKQAL